MIGFLLTGHGQFAPGLANALELVAGQQPAFKVVPFEVDKAAEYPELLQGAIRELRDETDAVIVFVDLLGGTPFNQAMMATTMVDGVSVVAGTNLPMLIETLFTRNSNESATVEELIETAVQAGQSGVVHKVLEVSDDEDDE